MKAKLKVSVHLHMGNYVNQVHHTTNTRESREVKIKINFALSNEGKVESFSSFAYMGNYVNQVHLTTNTRESREVKIKINFA